MPSSLPTQPRDCSDDITPHVETRGRLTPEFSRIGVIVRLLVTLGMLGALLAGTLYGDDDHFPFGPFRMYSSARDPDGVVNSTRMEGVDATGERLGIRGGGIGLRRAEIEGQLPRFRANPALLSEVADAYRQRNPDAQPLVRLEIIVRNYRLDNGKPTGNKTDTLVTAWDAPSTQSDKDQA